MKNLIKEVELNYYKSILELIAKQYKIIVTTNNVDEWENELKEVGDEVKGVLKYKTKVELKKISKKKNNFKNRNK
jgi:hypothetical protein